MAIPDVVLIHPDVHTDKRGFFMETYRENVFADHGIAQRFVQGNHSGSRQGTLRGLHYQIQQPQGKLVRVMTGKIFDVSVDLRASAPSFGRSVTVTLSAEKKQLLWVPPGFAHGFYVISESAEISYRTTDYHAPEWERTLLWNDPELKIDWPLIEGKQPLLSEKDAQGTTLELAELYS